MDDGDKEKAKKLAEEHLAWMKDFVGAWIAPWMALVEKSYKDGFEHGYKHGFEYMEDVLEA